MSLLVLDITDEELVRKIMQKGVAEIVERDRKKRYVKIPKCKVVDYINDPLSAQETKKLLHNLVDKINKADIRLSDMADKLKDITKDLNRVLKLSEQVKNLEFVNIALTAANIAVDVAGFIIIAQKIDRLGNSLAKIESELKSLKIMGLEDIREKCDKLVMDFNTIIGKIQANDAPSFDDLEEYLKEMKAFISKLVRLLTSTSVDTESLLNMIFTLLPSYTSILSIYIRSYYLEHRSTPVNYKKFLEVFREVTSDTFRGVVQDYYLLDRDFSLRDVTDIIHTQLYFIFNERLQIEDQLALLEVFDNREDFEAFEKSLDQIIEEDIAKINTAIAETPDEEITVQLLPLAIPS